jgi:hypothetical protein
MAPVLDPTKCFQSDQTRRAITQKSLSRVDARARMSTLQRDKLLTQSKILEKETSPPRKRRTTIPKQSPTRLNMVRIYNKTVVGWQQLC